MASRRLRVGAMAHVCDPSTQDAEEEDGEFETTLGI